MTPIVIIVAGLLMMTLLACSSSKTLNRLEFVRDGHEITVFDSAGKEG